tara:strand:+ start:942 stop:2099 length:1158 start_codon:yes stop_codon:yes gene_type:complete
MKLLFENWREYLNEQEATAPAKPGAKAGLKPMDPMDIKTPQLGTAPTRSKKEIPEAQLSDDIQIHNARTLLYYYKNQSNMAMVFTEGWGEGFDVPSRLRADPAEKLINYMVANNPVFHDNKIIEYLGGGTFGFVVALDNDHALKIFVGSFNPEAALAGDMEKWIDKEAGADVARYKGSQEKAFTGKGKAGDLMIYDQGKIKTPFEKDWHYAEMQMLRTLSHWMRYVHKVDVKDQKAVTEFNEKLDKEISILKELAYIANLVEDHGAKRIIDDSESDYQTQMWLYKFGAWHERPKEEPKPPIIDVAKFLYINTKEIAQFAELLEQGNVESIISQEMRLLDKKYAKNLFGQIKEILKEETLTDITDIRAVNVGVSQQDESLPIIFDY